MDAVQQLLLLSEKLYSFLATRPEDKEEKRTEYIQYVDKLLDARGQTIQSIQALEVNPIKGHTNEQQLIELDKGIRERLDTFKKEIAADLKTLQKSKKNEERYYNPYAAVRTMDGTYFDGKK